MTEVDSKNLNQLESLLSAERLFLHDVASPLAIILGLIEMVSSKLITNGPANVKEIERLKSAVSAIERIAVLINCHRERIASIAHESETSVKAIQT